MQLQELVGSVVEELREELYSEVAWEVRYDLETVVRDIWINDSDMQAEVRESLADAHVNGREKRVKGDPAGTSPIGSVQ